MTDQSRSWSAINAVINAGRDPTMHEAAAQPGTASLRTRRAHWGGGGSPAATLLSRLLTLTAACNKPCIQFTACGELTSASAVAMAISQAAATVLGRSLLLNARMDDEQTGEEPATDDPIPDGFFPELFHRRLAPATGGMDLLFGRERRSALTHMIAPFQFVAIDSKAPCTGPTSTALAPMCTGTVLVVQAGASRHAAIKEAAFHITRAGGRIVGSVLDQTPAKPAWIARP